MFRVLISAIAAYAIGNVQSAIILSRGLLKSDIREHGSRSAGATNMFRTFGAGWGILTLFCDALKGYLAFFLCRLIGDAGTGTLGVVCSAVGGFMVVFGHDYPVFYGFKGGKGIAASLGVATAIHPVLGLISLLIGVLAALITKYMSIGSLLALVFGLIASFVIGLRPAYRVMLAAIILLDAWQHRENIKRLANGTENPLFSSSLFDKIKNKNTNKRNLK